jgi:hypothetical protein
MNTQLIKSIAYIYSEIASLTLAIGPIKNPPLRRVYFVHSQGGVGTDLYNIWYLREHLVWRSDKI